MTHSSFDERRKALENAFFHKRDEMLLQQFRDRMERVDQKAKLAEATGIQDEALLDQMIDLDIGPDTLSALRLVPLVEVAWADGKVHAKQRQAVLTAAEQSGLSPQSDAHRLLQRWLDDKPEAELLGVWKAYIRCQSQRMENAARPCATTSWTARCSLPKPLGESSDSTKWRAKNAPSWTN